MPNDMPSTEHRSDGVDVLAEAFGTSRTRHAAAVFLKATGTWGFEVDYTWSVALLAVRRGSCWLQRPGAEPRQLAAGDLALLTVTVPGGGLASTPDGALVPHGEMFAGHPLGAGATLDVEGDGSTASEIVYAVYEPDRLAERLLASLPGLLVVKTGVCEQRGGLGETVRLLSAELPQVRPDGRPAVERLVDLLVDHTVRAWLAQNGSDAHVWQPATAADAAVTAALLRIRAEPARPWTVRILAAEVGLSRTTFTRRFAEMVGVPPTTYLTRWRLALAARRLRETDDPLRVVARDVGYGSEFTFSRAFTRAYGEPPGRFRANRRDPMMCATAGWDDQR